MEVKKKNILVHVLFVCVPLFLLVGLPVLYKANTTGLPGSADAVSSATVIQEKPSGEYRVYINREKHMDEETLQTWIDFFEGREISFLFEDIDCFVPEGDAAGLSFAQSLQSRLPANQMMIEKEDETLVVSRGDAGLYDIIIMSREMDEACGADSIAKRTDSVALTVGEIV